MRLGNKEEHKQKKELQWQQRTLRNLLCGNVTTQSFSTADTK